MKQCNKKNCTPFYEKKAMHRMHEIQCVEYIACFVQIKPFGKIGRAKANLKIGYTGCLKKKCD